MISRLVSYELEKPTESIRRGWSALMRYFDPTTFTVMQGVWAGLMACSFYFSHDLQSRPLMSHLARLGLSNIEWSSITGIDGMFLLASLAWPMWARSAVALMSSWLWFFIGMEILRGSLAYSTYSNAGMWDLFTGMLCWIATIQWAAQEGEGNGHRGS